MYFDSSPFLAAPEPIQALHKHATRVDCQGDGVLFRQGQDCKGGLYLLRSGEVTMSLEGAEGVDLWTVRLPPGSILELLALLGQTAYAMTTIAKGDAEVCFVTQEAFQRRCSPNLNLALMVLRVMAAEVRSARRALIRAMSFKLGCSELIGYGVPWVILSRNRLLYRFAGRSRSLF